MMPKVGKTRGNMIVSTNKFAVDLVERFWKTFIEADVFGFR